VHAQCSSPSVLPPQRSQNVVKIPSRCNPPNTKLNPKSSTSHLCSIHQNPHFPSPYLRHFPQRFTLPTDYLLPEGRAGPVCKHLQKEIPPFPVTIISVEHFTAFPCLFSISLSPPPSLSSLNG